MKRLILLFFLITLFISCTNRESFHDEKCINQFDWDFYNWITDASYYCFTQYISDLSYSSEEQAAINEYYNQQFQLYDFNYPIPQGISVEEMHFYTLISQLLNQYSIFNDYFNEFLNGFQDDKLFKELGYDEKIRVTLLAKTLIGISEASVYIEQENNKEQQPREAYTSANGESRFERRLHNCFSYRMDGHLETAVGTLIFIATLPYSLFDDIAICGNEIYKGFWNHVN